MFKFGNQIMVTCSLTGLLAQSHHIVGDGFSEKIMSSNSTGYEASSEPVLVIRSIDERLKVLKYKCGIDTQVEVPHLSHLVRHARRKCQLDGQILVILSLYSTALYMDSNLLGVYRSS